MTLESAGGAEKNCRWSEALEISPSRAGRQIASSGKQLPVKKNYVLRDLRELTVPRGVWDSGSERTKPETTTACKEAALEKCCCHWRSQKHCSPAGPSFLLLSSHHRLWISLTQEHLMSRSWVRKPGHQEDPGMRSASNETQEWDTGLIKWATL